MGLLSLLGTATLTLGAAGCGNGNAVDSFENRPATPDVLAGEEADLVGGSTVTSADAELAKRVVLIEHSVSLPAASWRNAVTFKQRCTGTLVMARYVLTAQHCTELYTPFGAPYFSIKNDHSTIKVIIPTFDSAANRYRVTDTSPRISVVRSLSVSRSDLIALELASAPQGALPTIVLCPDEYNDRGKRLTAVGFGQDVSRGDYNVLKKLDTTVVESARPYDVSDANSSGRDWLYRTQATDLSRGCLETGDSGGGSFQRDPNGKLCMIGVAKARIGPRTPQSGVCMSTHVVSLRPHPNMVAIP